MRDDEATWNIEMPSGRIVSIDMQEKSVEKAADSIDYLLSLIGAELITKMQKDKVKKEDRAKVAFKEIIKIIAKTSDPEVKLFYIINTLLHYKIFLSMDNLNQLFKR